MDRPPFFAIVVPAHNESAYIEDTLDCLLRLDYPKEKIEIIVVENGSTDDTFQKAQKYAVHGIKVLTSEKGVSRARNAGARAVSPAAEWVMFLDADTHLDAPFLKELSAFLAAGGTDSYVVGTASLRPFPSSFKTRIFYPCSNAVVRVSRAAYGGALIIRRDVLSSISFDETLQMGEDTNYVMQAKRHGRYFFFNSPYVYTSTRRYKTGSTYKFPILVGLWVFDMMTPYHARITTSIQRRFRYKAVR